MQFYELPGLSINSDSIVAVEKKGDGPYVLQLAGIGGYYLTAEQTEVFKKLVEKDSTSKSLSVKGSKGVTDPDNTVGEGTVHPAPNETFVPPIAENHPLNDIPGNPPPNQATDLSIAEPRLESPVIDASDNSPVSKADAAKAESKDGKDKDNKK